MTNQSSIIRMVESMKVPALLLKIDPDNASNFILLAKSDEFEKAGFTVNDLMQSPSFKAYCLELSMSIVGSSLQRNVRVGNSDSDIYGLRQDREMLIIQTNSQQFESKTREDLDPRIENYAVRILQLEEKYDRLYEDVNYVRNVQIDLRNKMADLEDKVDKISDNDILKLTQNLTSKKIIVFILSIFCVTNVEFLGLTLKSVLTQPQAIIELIFS